MPIKTDILTLHAAAAEALGLVPRYVLVPMGVADATAGTIALLGDERICKFGRPSPEAKLAMRNLATALGWKDGGTVDRA